MSATMYFNSISGYKLEEFKEDFSTSFAVREIEQLENALGQIVGLCPYPLHDHVEKEAWELGCKIATRLGYNPYNPKPWEKNNAKTD